MNFGYRQSQEQAIEVEALKRTPGILIPFLFLRAIISYSGAKLREIFMFSYAAFVASLSWLGDVKSWSVRKMFWGRSSFYKTAIHAFVGVFTLAITLTGISSRLDIFKDESSGLVLTSGIIGANDILPQEGTAESIVPSDPNQLGFQVFKHTVERGETLSSISAHYGISVDTIKWANGISPFSNTLAVGQQLDIPEIDGVLYTVKKGDSVSKIATTTKGNVFDIMELNGLRGENPILSEGQKLFVPFGSIDPPPVARIATGRTGTYISGPSTGISLPPGTFIRPLPSWCGSWSRGWSYRHHGVDIAQKGGCWLTAAAGGTVVIAGWRGAGQGYMVEIDHGLVNGKSISTRYYHGSGSYKVREGDKVAAGQDIMYMGSTGYSTGTHLHFEVVINGVQVNPENYVKLR